MSTAFSHPETRVRLGLLAMLLLASGLCGCGGNSPDALDPWPSAQSCESLEIQNPSGPSRITAMAVAGPILNSWIASSCAIQTPERVALSVCLKPAPTVNPGITRDFNWSLEVANPSQAARQVAAFPSSTTVWDRSSGLGCAAGEGIWQTAAATVSGLDGLQSGAIWRLNVANISLLAPDNDGYIYAWRLQVTGR